MAYVIIVIMLAVVAAPIIWMKPSPAQVRKARLRQKAMAAGLQVKVCDLPQSHRAKVRREEVKKGVVYRLGWGDNKPPLIGVARLCVATEQGFEWSEAPEAAIRQLIESGFEQIQNTITAIEWSGLGVGVYWGENGTEDTVLEISKWLQQLRTELIALIKEPSDE